MPSLQITAVEGDHSGDVVEADVNPTEIIVDRVVLWQHQVHKGPADLEFLQREAAEMMFELVFDGVESSQSVQPRIDKLTRFSSADVNLQRPPKLRVSWGTAGGGIPSFEAVIESFSTRYLIFGVNGIPLRAKVSLKLKEAAHLKVHTP
jgi:hypothetical protein